MNKRLKEFAKRHMNQGNLESNVYPTPEQYSMSKGDYYTHLEQRNITHPRIVEMALNSTRNIYKTLVESDNKENLIVTAVGSSLLHTAYKDIDILLLGIKNEEVRKKLFHDLNEVINGLKTKPVDIQNTFLYQGSVGGGSWQGGTSTSDFTDPGKHLIDFIVDETGKSFEEWHKMMVNIQRNYCILDRL